MMMFILGMLVMYLIVGVIVALDEIFGGGFNDGWFVYSFCWWNIPIIALVCWIIKTIKRRKQLKRNIKKVLTNIK